MAEVTQQDVEYLKAAQKLVEQVLTQTVNIFEKVDIEITFDKENALPLVRVKLSP